MFDDMDVNQLYKHVQTLELEYKRASWSNLRDKLAKDIEEARTELQKRVCCE